MNRKYLAAIALSSTLLIGSSLVALADPSLKEVNAFLNNMIKIEIDGQEVQFQDEQGRQLIPITYEGRTYLPIRSIGSALDMTVTWDSVNNRVILQKSTLIEDNPISGALKATYKIENDSIRLTNGKNEKEIAPDSATKKITRVWGESAVGDLNADGSNDAALILIQNTGGSGTFYYVAASIRNRENQQYIGTNSILLGDRIAPQNISIEKGTIIVNYADRKKDESMSTSPSVGISKYLRVEGNTLKEIKETL